MREFINPKTNKENAFTKFCRDIRKETEIYINSFDKFGESTTKYYTILEARRAIISDNGQMMEALTETDGNYNFDNYYDRFLSLPPEYMLTLTIPIRYMDFTLFSNFIKKMQKRLEKTNDLYKNNLINRLNSIDFKARAYDIFLSELKNDDDVSYKNTKEFMEYLKIIDNKEIISEFGTTILLYKFLNKKFITNEEFEYVTYSKLFDDFENLNPLKVFENLEDSEVKKVSNPFSFVNSILGYQRRLKDLETLLMVSLIS